MSKLRALGEMIIAVPVKKDTTEGGIVIPENVKQLPQEYAKVISVGEEITTVKVDDVVAFHQQAGQVIVHEKEVYKIVKYGEVYCVVG